MNQIIQTALGLGLGMLGEGDVAGMEEYSIVVWARRIEATRRTLPRLLSVIGIDAKGLARKYAGSGMGLAALLVTGEPQDTSHARLVALETACAGGIYWYIVPAIQFALALFAADTWQYFGHRWLHTNKWVYSRYTTLASECCC